MALRDKPLEIKVQDYLADEKLNLCSWATQGIYFKILCVLHKQETYGVLTLDEKFCFNKTANSSLEISLNKNANTSLETSNNKFTNTCLNFASVFINFIPCQIDDMTNALEELIYFKVLHIQDNQIFQKRLYQAGLVSEARSKAGKKGGGNPNFVKTKSQTPVSNFVKTNLQTPVYSINSIKKDDSFLSLIKEKKVYSNNKNQSIDYTEISNSYNATCEKMPYVRKLTEKRKRAIKKIVGLYDVETINEVFLKASESNFLNGENERGWTADLDWLMKPDNFVRVIEGRFQNRTGVAPKKETNFNKLQSLHDKFIKPISDEPDTPVEKPGSN